MRRIGILHDNELLTIPCQAAITGVQYIPIFIRRVYTHMEPAHGMQNQSSTHIGNIGIPEVACPPPQIYKSATKWRN
ncbi:UNVERIFIED_CONTAM: hypothetical protein FKN15_046164 [Acipenser sinensis]